MARTASSAQNSRTCKNNSIASSAHTFLPTPIAPQPFSSLGFRSKFPKCAADAPGTRWADVLLNSSVPCDGCHLTDGKTRNDSCFPALQGITLYDPCRNCSNLQ